MSNRVCVQYTKFMDISTQGQVTDVYFGYRIYDDHESVYNNTFASFYDLTQNLNARNVFSFIREEHGQFMVSIEFHEGVWLNGEWLGLKETIEGSEEAEQLSLFGDDDENFLEDEDYEED